MPDQLKMIQKARQNGMSPISAAVPVPGVRLRRTVTANPPARGAATKILKRRGQRPTWATVTKIRRL